MIHTPIRDQNKKQTGLTLIELMIAMVLGLILVAGVIQIFISNKQAYRVTDAHSKLQDNTRFALDLLSREVRSAGFSGCRSIDDMNVNIIANAITTATLDSSTIITGSNAQTVTTWLPNLPATLGTVVGGTDVITVQRGQSCGGNLVDNIGGSGAAPTEDLKIFLPNNCAINAGDTLMIADCTDAHIFRATTVTNGTGIQNIEFDTTNNQSDAFCKQYTGAACTTDSDKLYDFDAEVFIFNSATYFIRQGQNGQPALWVLDNNSAAGPIELIEGIEDMQIVYGSDSNDDDIVDDYRTADVIDAAGEWDQVISARISLLAQTQEQNLTTANQTVFFNGGNLTGTDGRLRRVFTSTIGVRNKVQ